MLAAFGYACFYTSLDHRISGQKQKQKKTLEIKQIPSPSMLQEEKLKPRELGIRPTDMQLFLDFGTLPTFPEPR